jgi:hypothetical protein
LVLLFAWLTLLPDWTPLPVNSQLRDMMHLFFFSPSVHALAGHMPRPHSVGHDWKVAVL